VTAVHARTPELSAGARAEIRRLAGLYEQDRSALLPALFVAQGESGHLPPPALTAVAEMLNLPLAQVVSTASFYDLLTLRPTGRHTIRVCTSIPCMLGGCEAVLERLQETLGIGPGQTTADGEFTLQAAECLAACNEAPVVLVDEELWGGVSAEEVAGILRGRAGRSPRTGPPHGGRHPPDGSILLKWAADGAGRDLDTYRRAGGYEAARRVARELTPDHVIEEVVASGLRGKGGAGFPAGQKWKFIPRAAPVKFLVANGDEGEPGTFKDRTLLEGCPHLLIEGILIAALAIGAEKAYVYLRREFATGRRLLEQALVQARAAGFVGRDIFGTRHAVEITLHSGGGAYIAGEESALLESLEGRPALPRLRPPFPAQAGLYRQPTLVHNVETLCHLPAIILLGPQRYRALGPPALFSVSGCVARPGVYEVPLGVTLRSLIFEYAGGLRPGRRFKAAFPGGPSTMLLTEADLDIPLDYDSLRRAGTMLGSAAVIVMDEATDMVRVATRAAQFYRHESCGKCTPCRIGTEQMCRLLAGIVQGRGQPGDLGRLEGLARSLRLTSLCGLGQTAGNAVAGTVRHFPDEYAGYLRKQFEGDPQGRGLQ